jgi:hypothetical protein
MKNTPGFIISAILVISCLNEPDCYQLTNDEFRLSFAVLGFGNDTDTLTDIRISGTDSIFYQNTIISSVVLPLNPGVKEVEYIFRWYDGSMDNLVLGYSAQIQFVSDECAQRYVFSNLHPINSSFDSVRVVNGTPTTPTSTNLVIYRCANPYRAGIKFKKGGTSTDSVVTVTNVSADFPLSTSLGGSRTIFFLPLNKAANTSTYSFEVAGGSTESLKLSYTRIVKASPVKDCDSVTFFSNLRITATSFDTTSTKVILPNTNARGTDAQDPATVNFEIFL